MIAKLAIGTIVIVALAFVAMVATLYIYQRSLIYPIPPLNRSVPEGFELVRYTTEDGLELQAGYRAPVEGMPTLLFFHGNATDWQSTFRTTELLAARGYGVLAAEYRGYNGNPGKPSEQGLYRDGRAAYAWLRERVTSPADIVLVGNSLGSGVATELASKVQARALMLIAPFKSMTATAANSYPFAPVNYLLQDRFENIAKIASVPVPLLVVHGEQDALIPLAHARELADTHAASQMVVLPGYGHNMSGEDAAQVPQVEFLARLARRD
ncbi:alpha/beta hydrolase [Alteraurantiacibacter aquimixticola]|nr:alpha/beta hydrolase [Alteraurantiacibacter aquimixticola]